jgi:flavin reductase (DIM6/NTAB) family NADH-FMN oxidoreductase RutF
MDKVKLGPKTLVYPKPALLVGAEVDGRPNFMAVAWGGVACGVPPMVSVAINTHRYTLQGIRQNMVFSVSVTPEDYATQTDYCGIISGKKTHKAADCGFEVFYGDLEGAPMVKQYPVNMECRVVQIIELGSHCLVIGEILETHVSADCLTDGQPDVAKIQPVAYMEGQAGDYYCMSRHAGKAFNIGKELKKG